LTIIDRATDRFDASGNVTGRFSDSYLVNEYTLFSRELAAPNTLFVWDPNIPLEAR
jgi:hypothetical protein